MSEYGDPGLSEEFDFIYPVSPIHNVPTNKILPATLIMVNNGEYRLPIDDSIKIFLGDDRVVPMHSFKFAATLQHSLPDNHNPLLILVDKSWLGHGEGKSTDRQ